MRNPVTKGEYNKAIEKVKGLINLQREIKYDIVKIALSVCVDVNGGSTSPKLYTFKKFADDCNIKFKTLYRWKREYEQVVAKIGINDPKRMALERTLKMVDKKTPKAQVKKIYNAYANQQLDSDEKDILDALKRMKTIQHLICNKLILKKCDKENLKQLATAARHVFEDIDAVVNNKPTKKDVLVRKAVAAVGGLRI